MRQRLYLRSSAFLICMLLCLPARAQPSSAPDICQSDVKCTELYQTASNLMKLEQNAAALALFQTAYAKYPAAWLLVHIGRAQQKLGQLVAAMATYRQYLASPDAQDDPELTRKAQEYLLQAESDFEPPPAPLEQQPPPPPPAAMARPVCPGEKDEPAESPTRPCERQNMPAHRLLVRAPRRI